MTLPASSSESPSIALRPVIPSDLEVFYLQQLDEEANRMAAFTAKDPADRIGFDDHWAKILADPGITLRTILYGEQVAGSILVHSWFGDPEISYWLGREYWGKGIATRALELFLEKVTTRPLYARAVKDNLASMRVLQKCGFIITGEEKGFANARGCEVAEIVLILRADDPLSIF